jgi:hypothetical protein
MALCVQQLMKVGIGKAELGCLSLCVTRGVYTDKKNQIFLIYKEI